MECIQTTQIIHSNLHLSSVFVFSGNDVEYPEYRSLHHDITASYHIVKSLPMAIPTQVFVLSERAWITPLDSSHEFRKVFLKVL